MHTDFIFYEDYYSYLLIKCQHQIYFWNINNNTWIAAISKTRNLALTLSTSQTFRISKSVFVTAKYFTIPLAFEIEAIQNSVSSFFAMKRLHIDEKHNKTNSNYTSVANFGNFKYKSYLAIYVKSFFKTMHCALVREQSIFLQNCVCLIFKYATVTVFFKCIRIFKVLFSFTFFA